MVTLRDMPPLQRVLMHVTIDPVTACWVWQQSVNHHGYGIIQIRGRRRPIHRVTYEAVVGPIPDGVQVDHLCRVRRCCNPAHLSLVTSGENTRRGERVLEFSGRCRKGLHDITLPGAIHVQNDGHRRCTECFRDALRTNARRRRAATT